MKTRLFKTSFLMVPFLSALAGAAESPVKLARIYNLNNDINPGTPGEFSPADVAQKFDVLILLKGYATDKVFPGGKSRVDLYRAAGFSGSIMQYIISDETYGGPWPGDGALYRDAPLDSLAEQQQYCTDTQRAFAGNKAGITMYAGSFCEIHDSIVAKNKIPQDASKKFDANLDGSANEYADESWFLHYGQDAGKDGGAYMARRGDRIVHYYNKGAAFMVNPGNKDFQTYYAKRAAREVLGGMVNGSPLAPSGLDGVFLDNVASGWTNVVNKTGGKPPLEYASSEAYAAAYLDFIKTVHAEFASHGIPLWGNLIATNAPSRWLAFKDFLDGALHESQALGWASGPVDAAALKSQLDAAEAWMSDGKHHFVAFSNGGCNKTRYPGCTQEHDQLIKFSLAAYLLIADGKNSSYYYTDYSDGSNYDDFFDRPEYYLNLGKPLQNRQAAPVGAAAPTQYTRQFECGQVLVDVAAKTGSITYDPVCPGMVDSTPPAPPRRLRAKP